MIVGGITSGFSHFKSGLLPGVHPGGVDQRRSGIGGGRWGEHRRFHGLRGRVGVERMKEAGVLACEAKGTTAEGRVARTQDHGEIDHLGGVSDPIGEGVFSLAAEAASESGL